MSDLLPVGYYAHPYDMLMGGKRLAAFEGKRYVLDYDQIALLPWEREMSPWRRLRRYRYGQASIPCLDPLDVAA